MNDNRTVDRETCPNPFCDGYGNIDVSPSINGRAWFPSACKVGPHPPMPSTYVFPRKRKAAA